MKFPYLNNPAARPAVAVRVVCFRNKRRQREGVAVVVQDGVQDGPFASARQAFPKMDRVDGTPPGIPRSAVRRRQVQRERAISGGGH